MAKMTALTIGFLTGGFARYALATRLYALTGTAFPWGTLAVNLSGCFLIGVFDSWAETRAVFGPEARLLLMTGFCGAYTTFSTLMLETNNLLADGQTARAMVNYFGSGLVGLALLRAGAALGKAF
jgi:CrcB protein